MSCGGDNGLGDAHRRERIRSAILTDAVRTREAGHRLISSRGLLQDWLIDLRPVLLRRAILCDIADEFWALYGGQALQLAGVEAAAIPLLTALLLRAPHEQGHVNAVIIRKERKNKGLCNSIEGALNDAPLILVDDIINSAGSAEKARMAIRQAGRSLEHVFALIDYRSRNGLVWRNRNNLQVRSLFCLADFNLVLHKNPAPPRRRYRELWSAAIPGAYPYYIVPKSTPLLLGDRLYRGCDSGKMHAFDAATGGIIWEHQVTGITPRKGIWSSPAVHDGRLYFGAYNGVIYCLDAGTGTEIWSQSCGEWVGASPVIAPRHGLVYFGIEYERPWARGSIGAYALEGGAKVWEHLTAKLQHGSPAYWHRGDLIVWSTADHETAGLDPASGKSRWTFKTRRSVKYAPAIDEARGLVALASFDKSIYVLDAMSGRPLGEWPTGEICYSTPLFTEHRLFCGSGDRHLYVIDLDRMTLVAKIDLGARIYSSPRLVGRHVIVGTSGGRVVEIDCDTLRIEGILQVPDAVTNAVAVSEDERRLFISTYMNYLYCFERGMRSSEPARSAELSVTAKLSVADDPDA